MEHEGKRWDIRPEEVEKAGGFSIGVEKRGQAGRDPRRREEGV